MLRIGNLHGEAYKRKRMKKKKLNVNPGNKYPEDPV